MHESMVTEAIRSDQKLKPQAITKSLL